MTDSHQHAVVLPVFGGPTTLRQRIALGLRAAIATGSLQPGRVYSVPALAAEYGVSATPVREAMLDLVRDRLVEVVRNKGFRVVDVEPAELVAVNEVRLLVEPAAVASLAGRLSSLQLEGLRAYVDAILTAAQQGERETAAEAAFELREVMVRLCPNTVLVDTVTRLRARARAGYPRVSIDYAKFATTQYGLMADLESGDKEKVSRTIAYEISRYSPILRPVT
jgi:DNA-binding GntR family transcriptional regulator